MKKLMAMLLALCLLLGCASAVAEEETGEATNPYTIESLGWTIALPSSLTVTSDNETEEQIQLAFALDGRADCGYSLTISYVEAYAGYDMTTLPDEQRQELIDYYKTNFPGPNEPAVEVLDEDFATLSPLIASGTGSDGNLYCVYITVIDGYCFTVSGAIAAEQFDQDSYGALYNLFWQTMDMLIENVE